MSGAPPVIPAPRARAMFIGNRETYTRARAEVNRQRILAQLQLTPHTYVATIDYRIRARNHRTGVEESRWRRTRIVVPMNQRYAGDEVEDALDPIIKEKLREDFEAQHQATLSGHWLEDHWHLDVYLDNTGEPEYNINSVHEIFSYPELQLELGIRSSDMGLTYTQSMQRNVLYDDKPHHRSFHYLIQGCDHNTLFHLMEPDDHEAAVHRGDVVCHGTCMYDMLERQNARRASQGKCTIFQRENVLKFMKEKFNLQSVEDGMSAEQLQAHAEQFNYGHWACDIARNTLFYHQPDPNRNKATVAYVVTGTHCQPISDTNVLNSIMKMCSARFGVRKTNGTCAITDKPVETKRKPKRNRPASVSRVLETDGQGSTKTETDGLGLAARDVEPDILAPSEDTLEDIADCEDEDGVAIPEVTTKQRWVYPTVDQTERFFVYPKAEMKSHVEEKCRPDYWSPGPRTHIHYYVTSDETDVQYIYHYLVRVLGIDPLRYARSYQGVCNVVRMNNTHWVACSQMDLLVPVHRLLCPKDPFRAGTLAKYAVYIHRMCYRRIMGSSGGGALLDVKSVYSPNMHRLADVTGKYKTRSCMLRKTFTPPYSDPRRGAVQTLIPMSQRRRIDIIRSYAAVLANLDASDHESVCIHGLSDRVVPYDAEVHRTIPCGHYVVRIPRSNEIKSKQGKEDWEIWYSCYAEGSEVMITHRLLRGWLQRGLLKPEELPERIVWVCCTNEYVQRQHGLQIVTSLITFVKQVYTEPDIPAAATKMLVNCLVGSANGITTSVCGARLLFKDLPTLWQLLNNQISEDQIRKIKIMHTMGMDPEWHRMYDYYELDTSGIRYCHQHMQPLFEMVLEQQALNVFDLCRMVPAEHRIQIHIDAVEYRIPDPRHPPEWARKLETDKVSAEEYARLTPEQMWTEGYMGRYKDEYPKPADLAVGYHYQTRTDRPTTIFDRPLDDREDTTVVFSWHESLRVITDDVEELWRGMVECASIPRAEWGEDDMQPIFNTSDDCSGCLITGPAGTGKTRALKLLVEYAREKLHARVLLTAYTHAACVQMGPEAITLASLFGVNTHNASTRELMTSQAFANRMSHLYVDWLVVDEISLIPYNYLELLHRFHRTHTRTRIVLVGDFHQLPPIEKRGGPLGLGDDYDYFWTTDIFPYLIYDTVANKHGHWLKLTKCHRTDDPILQKIAEDPLSVTRITAEQFPLFPEGGEIWRFLSVSNSVRKACNFYCMTRYLQKHVGYPSVHLCLRDLWVRKQLRKKRPDEDMSVVEEQLREKFDNGQTGTHQPLHWQYLQDFTYAVGMPVACRQTVQTRELDVITKSKVPSDGLELTNNRRARIVDIDTEERRMILRWDDVAARHRECPTEFVLETQDIEISYEDFAFHFVPAFCTTIHCAQGETIQEHYAVLEWNNVLKNPKSAYVAVTRGAASYLHLIPWCSKDPWNINTTSSLAHNCLRELFHLYCWRKVRSCRVNVEDVLKKLEDQKNKCQQCGTELKLIHYMDTTSNRFRVRFLRDEPLSAQDFDIICHSCVVPLPSKNNANHM